MTSLRLLKISVQPVFVIDDGDTLTEQQGQVLTVTPAGWKQFSETFISEINRVTAEFTGSNEEESPVGDVS